MNKALVAMEKEWQVQSDLETMMRYAEIKKDPKRIAAVKKLAKKRYEELEAAGLCGDKEGKDDKD